MTGLFTRSPHAEHCWHGNVPIAISEKAVVVRKADGDTHEDGTITAKGERKFFGQRDLVAALLTSENYTAITNLRFAQVVAHNLVDRFGIYSELDDEGFIDINKLLRNKNSFGARGFVQRIVQNIAQSAQDTAKLAMDVSSDLAKGDATLLLAQQKAMTENMGNLGGRLVGEAGRNSLTNVARTSGAVPAVYPASR